MKENGYIKNRLKSKNLESSDKNLFKESLYSFIEKPLKHFFTSIYFLGAFGLMLQDRFSLYYAFFSLIYFNFYFLKLIYQKKIEAILMLSPVILSLLFHSIFT